MKIVSTDSIIQVDDITIEGIIWISSLGRYDLLYKKIFLPIPGLDLEEVY
jgi:hypothetical protein